MSRQARALIIGVILFVLLVFGAGIYKLSEYKNELIARGAAEMTEGRNAGRATDNQGCVDQSVTRYKAGPGFAGTMTANLFMRGCLEVSSPTPGFCDEVPKETEILKSVDWRIAQCKSINLSADQYCQQFFAPVQSFCDKSTPK